MKRLLFLCLFLCSFIQSSAQYFPIDTLRLNNSYKEFIKDTNSLKKQKEFLDAFPSTFSELIMVYQYIPDSNYDLTMYHKLNNHFHLGLGKLDLIPTTIYCDKLINLSIGGRKDFTGYKLKSLIGDCLVSNLDIMLERLHEKAYVEQFSFWYFYFLNTMPFDYKRDIGFPNLREKMKDKYPEDVKLMEIAHNVSYDKKLRAPRSYPHLWDKIKGKGSSLFRENMIKEDARRSGFKYKESYSDALLINNKRFYFKRTPINYFEGYTNLYKDNGTIIMSGVSAVGDKGYTITWVVVKQQLYISDVQLHLPATFSEKQVNGKLVTVADKNAPIDIIKRKLEQFTGKKFNKKGLLPATWVNGELGLLTIKPTDYKKLREKVGNRYRNNQEHYSMKFKNGKYVSMKLVKGKTIIK